MNRRRLMFLGLALYGLVFVLASGLGSMAYFHFGDPQHTCASCHEMTDVHSGWSASAHRTLHCRSCHGGSLTLDAHALQAHVNRVVQHFAGDPEKPIRLTEAHVLDLQQSCRSCHPQSFADWQSSRHAADYARIFLDPVQNTFEHPAADCLRCHGMFFDGSIEQLVGPLNTTGPWTLVDPAKAKHPTIPCLACHQIHTPAGAGFAAQLYESRDKVHIAVGALPVPVVTQGDRRVRLSPDPRQRLCTQCHAPDTTHRLGSADDRTPAGVHEGLSCLDCHGTHTLSTRASCVSCHTTGSNCGLDVTKMDTTFLLAASRHNIHTVACRDCHPQGAPAKKSGQW
jgi:hypothetical protein